MRKKVEKVMSAGEGGEYGISWGGFVLIHVKLVLKQPDEEGYPHNASLPWRHEG
jgi:hypothetical protein